MKQLASALFLSLLGACASPVPAPDWQSNAFASLSAYSSAYLSGDTRVANAEFARARQAIASTGRSDLMARAELVRCAAQVASLVFEPCAGYQALATDAKPAEQAYAAFISGRLRDLNPALLPQQYRELPNAGQAAGGLLSQIQDPQSRLIAAAVLLINELLSPVDIDMAVDTASEQGWRRPLLAWLGVQLKKAQSRSDPQSTARLQRRIDLVLQDPRQGQF